MLKELRQKGVLLESLRMFRFAKQKEAQNIRGFPCGLVVRISDFHPGGLGSVPHTGG